MTDTSVLAGRRVVAPYVTPWSEEGNLDSPVVERPDGGIGYVDERVFDRDERGVLWFRAPWAPRVGRPNFLEVHPVRQRRTMRRLLCQVCAGPADRTSEGVLWLLKDHRDDWAGWPEGMGVTEPPVCRGCVGVAARLCPALRRGAVAVRARLFPLAGVSGMLYRPQCGVPVPVGKALVDYDDPRIRWMCAGQLIRRLHDCTLVPVETVAAGL
jgi:hypothetical protein